MEMRGYKIIPVTLDCKHIDYQVNFAVSCAGLSEAERKILLYPAAIVEVEILYVPTTVDCDSCQCIETRASGQAPGSLASEVSGVWRELRVCCLDHVCMDLKNNMARNNLIETKRLQEINYVPSK